MQGVWARLQQSVLLLHQRDTWGVVPLWVWSKRTFRAVPTLQAPRTRSAEEPYAWAAPAIGQPSLRRGLALRWEVCVQELCVSRKSTFTEHPMAARQAPDGTLGRSHVFEGLWARLS